MSNGESSNHILTIAGLLAVAGVALYFFVPAGTVDIVAQQVGLQSPVLGLVNTQNAFQPDGDRPAPVKRESATSRSVDLTRARNLTAEDLELKSITSKKQTQEKRARPNLLKSTAATSGGVFLANANRPVIKISSIERGHLIEKCLYRNGSIEVLVDGEVALSL